MVGRKAGVPDAWDDDDWEVQADRAAKEESKNPTPAPVLSKAERLAEHTTSNRKLWEAAETNETFHYLEASTPIPQASTFKPQVKVLSRKPVIAKRGGPSSAMGQLSLGDDDDDDAKKKKQLTPEELRAKQKRDHDEKQRKYDEARAKIFGESAPSSRGSSPGTGTLTPPRTDGRYNQQQNQAGRARGRGGAQRDGGRRQQQMQQVPQPQQQQTSATAPARELYDPNYSARPNSASGFQRRDERLQNRDEGAPIRAPRGPDGSGRGGFGFARRGA